LIEVTAWAGLTVLIFLKNNSASILSWWSVLLAEETGVRRENHRSVEAKHFEDCITSNIVEKRTCNNTQGFELPDYKKQQYQHSFFVNSDSDHGHDSPQL
jgi:hypothetical protein